MRKSYQKFSKPNIQPYVQSKKSKSNSKSPVKSKGQSQSVFIYNFEEIGQYKQQSQPRINPNGMQKIKYRREILAKVTAYRQKRLNNSQLSDHESSIMKIENGFKNININESKQKLISPHSKSKYSLSSYNKQAILKEKINNFQQLDRRNINEMVNLSQKLNKQKIKVNRVIGKENKHQNFSTFEQKGQDQVDEKILDFDDIVNMKQIKYKPKQFEQHFNMFAHRKKKSAQPEFITYFRKNNFCQTSMISALNKKQKSINILEHLSPLIRQLVKHNQVEQNKLSSVFNVLSYQIDFGHIKLQDMIAVCNGWLEPDNLQQLRYDINGKIANDATQEIKVIKVENPTERQKLVNAKFQQYLQDEAIFYKKITLTPSEVNHEYMMKKRQEQLNALLQFQMNLSTQNIKDRCLLGQIEKDKSHILNSYQQQMHDARLKRLSTDIQRKVRYLKQNKNKIQNIGLQSIITSLANKKVYEQMFRQKKKKIRSSSLGGKHLWK